jgi:heat shock protein HslJ
MGGYATVGDGALRFAPLATTRMSCTHSPVDEREFLAALGSVTRYRIAGNTLVLNDGERAMLLFVSGT